MSPVDDVIPESDGFYDALIPFASFASITEPECYQPLPSDWIVGLADVVASGKAIADGRYKAVNTVGAAVIAAVTNALPTITFPFAFAGDGASLAVPTRHSHTLTDALARTAAWSQDALGLELRVGAIPIRAIREAGLDVRVARYGVGREVSYAMFTGGGMAWAEERLKEGAFRLPRADPGSTPDLSGLTCGFATVGSVRGTILSVIVIPQADDGRFAKLVADVVRLIEASDADGPVSRRQIDPGFPDTALSDAISRAQPAIPAAVSTPRVSAPALPSHVGPDFGKAEKTVQDTDFRKFGDGLRMTIDCELTVADAIERMLSDAQAAGICFFGAHRQDAANLTCLLPSAQSKHAHFVDGAQGGYAAASTKLKATIAA